MGKMVIVFRIRYLNGEINCKILSNKSVFEKYSQQYMKILYELNGCQIIEDSNLAQKVKLFSLKDGGSKSSLFHATTNHMTSNKRIDLFVHNSRVILEDSKAIIAQNKGFYVDLKHKGFMGLIIEF